MSTSSSAANPRICSSWVLDLPAISKWVIDVLGYAAPAACLSALGLLAKVQFFGGKPGRKRFVLARRGFDPNHNPRLRTPRGLSLYITAMVALIVSFALENEIRVGPNRAIDALTAGIQNPPSWIMQKGTSHLMNDSRISEANTTAILSAGQEQGIEVIPLQAVLAIVSHDDRDLTGFVFAAPNDANINPIPRDGHQCDSADNEPCTLGSNNVAIVDSGNGIDIGEKLTIRGQTFVVIAHSKEPRGLINRLVVYVSPSGFDLIEPIKSTYALVLNSEQNEANQMLTGLDLQEGLEVLSAERIRLENEKFWRGNGTPLMLLLILMITVLAAASVFASQRSEQEHHRQVLGTLWAIGLQRHQMVELVLLRAIWTVLLAGVPSWVLAYLILQFTNNSIIGFEARLRGTDVVAAIGLMSLVGTCSALALVRQIRAVRPASML